MPDHAPSFSSILLIACGLVAALPVSAQPDAGRPSRPQPDVRTVQIGPRPYFLVEDMEEGELKTELKSCVNGPFKPSDFSIGHRGACLQFPEHTKESYEAAAVMGAGIIECDVTFTDDLALVCRHSQCDLHTTTNILLIPDLAAKCTQPFVPYDPGTDAPASAQCCTSDITLADFRRLRGKMDASNPRALTPAQYVQGTAPWRTDLYSGNTSGTLLTHAESIQLIKSLGRKFTPELKSASVVMPYHGMSQAQYAQKMIDEYVAAGVSPDKVWPQSFNLADVLYWIQNTPAYGEQAVYLDDIDTDGTYPTTAELQSLVDQGVNIVAPPTWALVTLDGGEIVPSAYATRAKAAGLDIITWTLERSGLLQNGGGWYYQSTTPVINNDGDTMKMLDVLAQDVGVLGVFSDWPATTTYYANCKGLK